jgi:hypothetical protein
MNRAICGMEDSFGKFALDYLRKEWSVICGAPISFFVCVIIIVTIVTIVIWKLITLFYEARLSTQEVIVKSKDATIEQYKSAAETTQIQLRSFQKQIAESSPSTAKPVATSLELCFYGDERTPTEMRSENIFTVIPQEDGG